MPAKKDALARLKASTTSPQTGDAEPTLPSNSVYRNQNTNFGSYLIAANLLRFLGVQLAPTGSHVDLLFDDPEARGPDLLRRYNAGAAELVNARTLYEVRGYLMSEVKRIQSSTVAGVHRGTTR